MAVATPMLTALHLRHLRLAQRVAMARLSKLQRREGHRQTAHPRLVVLETLAVTAVRATTRVILEEEEVAPEALMVLEAQEVTVMAATQVAVAVEEEATAAGPTAAMAPPHKEAPGAATILALVVAHRIQVLVPLALQAAAVPAAVAQATREVPAVMVKSGGHSTDLAVVVVAREIHKAGETTAAPVGSMALAAAVEW